MNFDSEDYDHPVSGYSENWEESDPFNHMADEHSGDYDDEYDRYEDAYLDDGYDPYNLFDGAFDVPRVERLLRSIKRVAGRVAMLLIELRYGRNAVNVDGIPF